jgi:hypothetical protein
MSSDVKREDILLPESLWGVMERLKPLHHLEESPAGISLGKQIAHTAQSSVLFANFQGLKVAVKVGHVEIMNCLKALRTKSL